MLTWASAYYLSEWLIRLVMLVYVPNRRSPAAARTWLLLIFLLPWPGLIVYSVLGRVYLNRPHRGTKSRLRADSRRPFPDARDRHLRRRSVAAA